MTKYVVRYRCWDGRWDFLASFKFMTNAEIHALKIREYFEDGTEIRVFVETDEQERIERRRVA